MWDCSYWATSPIITEKLIILSVTLAFAHEVLVQRPFVLFEYGQSNMNHSTTFARSFVKENNISNAVA